MHTIARTTALSAVTLVLFWPNAQVNAAEPSIEVLDDIAVDLAEDGSPLEAPESLAGLACQVACAMAYQAGCSVISVSCPLGSTITLGSFALPCAVAVVAACTASAGGAVICINQCPS